MIVSGWAVYCVLLMVAMGCLYIFLIRPRLMLLPTFAEAFTQERTRWEAFRAWLKGRASVFTVIWGEIVAIGPDALQQLSGLDLKALFHLPDLWAAWATAMIPVALLLVKRVEKQ